MGQRITIGGQRLGAGGERIQQDVNNYYRSTHDLSESIVTSMACGVLTPFVVKPMVRGDVFEIDTDAACRTIPTKGPLFGSYKLQGDYFFYPARLVQALLHNNPLDIGMQMDKVMLPTITIKTTRGAVEHKTRYGKFNLSSLMKYCGMSGLGRAENETIDSIQREIECVPMLGYYDIYKNFYANKQEESGKVISIKNEAGIVVDNNTTPYTIVGLNLGEPFQQDDDPLYFYNIPKNISNPNLYKIGFLSNNLDLLNNIIYANCDVLYDGGNGWVTTNLDYLIKQNPDAIEISKVEPTNTSDYYDYIAYISIKKNFTYNGNIVEAIGFYTNRISIKPSTASLEILDFPLKNLDDMRYKILSHHELGVPFKLGYNTDNDWNHTSGQSGDGLPYSTLFAYDYENKTANKYPMNGLCLKTYQNDIYNIWINSELIDGENGVNNLSKVNVTDGAFNINSLLYAQKLFDLYNRIAVSDGSYDGWLNLVYEQEDRISHEKPLYLGGFYNEIVFEEIVQSAPADGDPLGELGGKGTLAQKTEGGKIVIKASEPGFLIGIASITPRIYYTQQNEFYITDIKSIDDFHKPELDQIGFQDLIGERLCFEDTVIGENGEIIHRSKIGKLPAWLEYQTSVDKAFGDLAEPNGNGYMILNRNYEVDDDGIIDATTYIDPTKYNYAFAYQALDAQNFWVQVKIKNEARRLMSANLLPNI